MMSFLTPPPEFEECADTTMLGTNNSLTDMFNTSPSTSSSSYKSGSYSPYTPPSSTHDHSFLEPVDDFSKSMFEKQMFDSAASLAFDSSAAAATAFNMDMPLNMYDQSGWNPNFSLGSQYPPLSAADDSAFFTGFNSTDVSLQASMLPPTPQTMTSQFGSHPMRMSDASYFMDRTQFTPAPSTAASTSRSCSPTPHMGGSGHHIHRGSRSRQSSVASASSPLSHYGIPVLAPGASPNSAPQAWRCAYPNCASRATFIRGCDLRKHYNRHSKHLFCRVDGCPQSEVSALAAAQAADPHCKDPSQLILSGGFSSKKDRARHEAKHNPGIKCEWQGPDGEGCGRVFSRMDNMKDHVRRIHQKSPSKNESAAERAERLRKSRR